MPSIATLFKLLARRIHRPQIACAFPLDKIDQWRRDLPVLPASFEVRHPTTERDFDAIGALLQQEPGFGLWTQARVRAEIFDTLADPSTAMLILQNGVPVACAFATDASTWRRRIAHGMYLYVSPAYRSKTNLGAYISYSLLIDCVEAGYHTVIAYTDPERLSALLLYLSIGGRPQYDCLTSFWRWRRILRRLAPALARLARTGARRGAAIPEVGARAGGVRADS